MSNEDTPTEPLTIPLPTLPHEIDEPVDTGTEEKPRVPEPALARGAITAVLGIIGILVGRQIDPALVEYLVTLYVTVGPIALAWWIRRNVTPAKK